MYLETLLNPAALSFVNRVRGTNTTTPLFSMAVARYLAYSYTLPSEEVACVPTYFRQHHQISLYGRLNDLVELFDVDVDTIVAYTQKLYEFRYLCTTELPMSVLGEEGLGVASFLAMNRCFSVVELELINTRSKELLPIYQGVREVLCCIDKASKEKSHGVK